MKTVNFLSNSEGQIAYIQEPRVIIRKAIPLKTAQPGSCYYFEAGSNLCVRGVTPNEFESTGAIAVINSDARSVLEGVWRFLPNTNGGYGQDEEIYYWDINATFLLNERYDKGYYIVIPIDFDWQKFITDQSYRNSLTVYCNNCQTTCQIAEVVGGKIVGKQIDEKMMLAMYNDGYTTEGLGYLQTFVVSRRYRQKRVDEYELKYNPICKHHVSNLHHSCGHIEIWSENKKIASKSVKIVQHKFGHDNDSVIAKIAKK